MNCKEGDNAMSVWAFKPDPHYDELLGRAIKCTNLAYVGVAHYEHYGPIMLTKFESYPMWELPKPHTCKCGCVLYSIPDAMLQPLPKLGDEKTIETETNHSVAGIV